MNKLIKGIFLTHGVHVTDESGLIQTLFDVFGVSPRTHRVVGFEKTVGAEPQFMVVSKTTNPNYPTLMLIEGIHGEIFKWWYAK